MNGTGHSFTTTRAVGDMTCVDNTPIEWWMMHGQETPPQWWMMHGYEPCKLCILNLNFDVHFQLNILVICYLMII